MKWKQKNSLKSLRKKQGFSRAANLIIFMNIISETFFFNKMRKCQQQKSINSDLPKIEFWSSFKKSNQ